jgi:hypothetical protein
MTRIDWTEKARADLAPRDAPRLADVDVQGAFEKGLEQPR